MAVEQHPGAAAAEFIAGAVDEQAVGSQIGLDSGPRVGDGFLGVLAQDVERADEGRSQTGQFEAATGEADAVAGFDDAGRVDFQTDHLEVGADGAQASGQLEGGPGAAP